ncbi:hypothetical protein VP01_769g5 [Puccinia sorghi]|uniref:Uncharacterized protein n=1 Tax=Puccinia sorghi TaxID=27349 RepID=A0A0L6UBP6_9BASI|nr:hypothetical protein VP01_769g5 [Puccinia sorghi]
MCFNFDLRQEKQPNFHVIHHAKIFIFYEVIEKKKTIYSFSAQYLRLFLKISFYFFLSCRIDLNSKRSSHFYKISYGIQSTSNNFKKNSRIHRDHAVKRCFEYFHETIKINKKLRNISTPSYLYSLNFYRDTKWISFKYDFRYKKVIFGKRYSLVAVISIFENSKLYEITPTDVYLSKYYHGMVLPYSFSKHDFQGIDFMMYFLSKILIRNPNENNNIIMILIFKRGIFFRQTGNSLTKSKLTLISKRYFNFNFPKLLPLKDKIKLSCHKLPKPLNLSTGNFDEVMKKSYFFFKMFEYITYMIFQELSIIYFSNLYLELTYHWGKLSENHLFILCDNNIVMKNVFCSLDIGVPQCLFCPFSRLIPCKKIQEGGIHLIV